MTRREVRVSETFFEELDRQLKPERGPDGEPSATDFIVIDLPAIVEVFATSFDDLPVVQDGISRARMLIGTAVIVPAFVVHGIETTDGLITLSGVEISLGR